MKDDTTTTAEAYFQRRGHGRKEIVSKRSKNRKSNVVEGKKSSPFIDRTIEDHASYRWAVSIFRGTSTVIRIPCATFVLDTPKKSRFQVARRRLDTSSYSTFASTNMLPFAFHFDIPLSVSLLDRFGVFCCSWYSDQWTCRPGLFRRGISKELHCLFLFSGFNLFNQLLDIPRSDPSEQIQVLFAGRTERKPCDSLLVLG